MLLVLAVRVTVPTVPIRYLLASSCRAFINARKIMAVGYHFFGSATRTCSIHSSVSDDRRSYQTMFLYGDLLCPADRCVPFRWAEKQISDHQQHELKKQQQLFRHSYAIVHAVIYNRAKNHQKL